MSRSILRTHTCMRAQDCITISQVTFVLRLNAVREHDRPDARRVLTQPLALTHVHTLNQLERATRYLAGPLRASTRLTTSSRASFR